MKNILIAALVLALGASPDVAAAQAKPVVKIGVSLPLTGDMAHMGEGVRNAMTLAKENLPGDTKYGYELVFEDDMLESKKAATAASKMINADKVDALVSLGSGTGGVISPIAERGKVIHFGIASAAEVANGEYNFNHWTSPEEEARVMAAELQKRGYKKVAGIFLNQQGVLAVRDALKARLEGTGIEFVTDEIVNPGEKDFRTLIGKAQAAAPDIYLIIFFTPELEILSRQMKEAGVTAPVTSIEAFGLSNEQALYEGLWYVDSAQAEEGFSSRYQARFAKTPGFASANAYDVFSLIVRGYETAAAPPGVKPSRQNVVKALYKVRNFDGMLGNLAIDEKGVVFSPAAVKTIRNGVPELLEAAP